MMKLNIKNWTNQNIKVVIFLVLFTLFGSCTKYKEKTLQDIGYWDVVFKNNKYETEPFYGFGFKEPNFSKLLCEPNREYKRKVIKVPLLPVGIELRMPAPHIIIEYRRLVHEHIKKLTNK